MSNMNALSLMVRKLCAKLKFSKGRSKVTVKVTLSKFMVPAKGKGLVIRNTYAKYESPISYGKKVMCRVKVFQM